MKRCFIAIILSLFSLSANAQYVVIGINAGTGFLYDENSSYFGGTGRNNQKGIDLGIMISSRIGIITGIAESDYSFSIPGKERRSSKAMQTVTYHDVPIAVRYILLPQYKVHMYFQPGVKVSIVKNAHYKPLYITNPYYPEHDNNSDLKKVVVRPVLNFGFYIPVRSIAAICIGSELSNAFQDVIRKDTKLSSATVNLVYGAMKASVQIHIGDCWGRKKLKAS